MSRLTRDGTAEPVSRDQILRHERRQGNINFPCSADHVQDWQPYPVDPYSCYSICVTIHICIYMYLVVRARCTSTEVKYYVWYIWPSHIARLNRENEHFPVPVRA